MSKRTEMLAVTTALAVVTLVCVAGALYMLLGYQPIDRFDQEFQSGVTMGFSIISLLLCMITVCNAAYTWDEFQLGKGRR